MDRSTLKNRLLDLVSSLREYGASLNEQSFRITISDEKLSQPVASAISEIGSLLEQLVPGIVPNFRIDGESLPLSDAVKQRYNVSGWQLVFEKKALAEYWKLREDEETVLFFGEHGFLQWLQVFDPFKKNSNYDPDFRKSVTVRVHGLDEAFGGPDVWVVPTSYTGELPDAGLSRLPSATQVNNVVHINGSDEVIRIDPRGWAVTWGATSSAPARSLLRLTCLVLASCLTNEITFSRAGSATISIRGPRRVQLPLWHTGSELDWKGLNESLMKAVAWVYEERPETRLKLLLDRLTLDLGTRGCYIESLHAHLSMALRQAQDSYGFVILDRKDAYVKEMREIMKDMKSQADLYAEKTRAITSALIRDFLGVLLIIALSFMGKFDRINLHALLASPELSIFVKILAGYLALSMLLQFATNIRDDLLSYSDANRWIAVLRNYTSSDEAKQNFLSPIARRRDTLHVAMVIIAILYACLIMAVLYLPSLAKFMLY